MPPTYRRQALPFSCPYYQKTSGLRSFSSSLVTILNPVLATALYAFAGIDIVIYVDHRQIDYSDTVFRRGQRRHNQTAK